MSAAPKLLIIACVLAVITAAMPPESILVAGFALYGAWHAGARLWAWLCRLEAEDSVEAHEDLMRHLRR